MLLFHTYGNIYEAMNTNTLVGALPKAATPLIDATDDMDTSILNTLNKRVFFQTLI